MGFSIGLNRIFSHLLFSFSVFFPAVPLPYGMSVSDSDKRDILKGHSSKVLCNLICLFIEIFLGIQRFFIRWQDPVDSLTVFLTGLLIVFPEGVL